MRKLTLLLLALAAASCSAAAESDQKGAEIIAAAKAATGGNAWDNIQIWHETGHALLPSGESTRYEHWADLHSLKTRNLSIGESGTQYTVFDGQAAYQSSNSSFRPRSELNGATMKYGAYVACFGFFFPQRFEASFHFKGTHTDHDASYDVVTVSPAGLDSVDVWVDQKTHRISRYVYANGRFQTVLSDYRHVGAVSVPFTSVDGGSRIQTDSIAFESEDSAIFSLEREQ